MHATAFDFVRRVVQSLPVLHRVVEFGSRSVNGSVREIFTDAREYVGVDPVAGPGVSVVADAASWNGGGSFDCVVCCEMLEHAPDIAGICASAYRALRCGGSFIVTCATDPRSPHSADGDGPPKYGEFYRNVRPHDLCRAMREAGFDVAAAELVGIPGDLHCFAMRVR